MDIHRTPLRRREVLTGAAALFSALALAGCGSDTDATASAGSASSASGGAGFPVTLADAFGSTTITSAPKRVVTLGWGSTDAAIALGTIPVAMEKQAYAGDSDGVLPWVREAVTKAGGTLPTVLPATTDDPPYEAIAAAKPDLILAPYSGITAKQQKLLKAIAPVVAYPKTAWATPWRDVITITGKALGARAAAAKVLAKIESEVAAQASAHPELKGKSVAMVADTAGTLYVYRKEDPRVAFALDLGMTDAPSVDALANGAQTFYYTLSTEKADQLTSDVLVSFAASAAEEQTFLTSSYGSSMPQVKAGTVAGVVGPQLVSSVSPPTALSLPWGLEDYVAALSKAAKAVA